MSGFAAAVLLCILIEAVQGYNTFMAKSNFKSLRDHLRQEPTDGNCDSFSNEYPESCLDAQQGLLDYLTGASLSTQDIDTFCTTRCVQPVVDYYNCLSEPDSAVFVNNTMCGTNGDKNCLVSLNEDVDNNVQNAPCLGTDSVCDASCQDFLRALIDQWGCCAAGYYEYKDPPCDIDAGNVCDGVVGAGFAVCFGLGLITVFAMLAAWTNVALI